MKKVLKMFVIMVVCFLFFIGCVASLAGNDKESSKERPRVSKEVTVAKSDVEKYRDEIEPFMKDFSQQCFSISDLLQQYANDPSVYFDDEWIANLAASLAMLQIDMDGMRDITPPKEMKPFHDMQLKAYDHMDYVVDNLPTAIDHNDVDLMNKVNWHEKEGLKLMNKANELIK